MKLKGDLVALTALWQMDESKRRSQESGAHSMTLLAAGDWRKRTFVKWRLERPIASAMAGLVRASPSRLRFLAILSKPNAGNQDSQSPLKLATLLKPGQIHHFP